MIVAARLGNCQTCPRGRSITISFRVRCSAALENGDILHWARAPVTVGSGGVLGAVTDHSGGRLQPALQEAHHADFSAWRTAGDSKAKSPWRGLDDSDTDF